MTPAHKITSLLVAILILLPAVLFSSLKSASFIDLDDGMYVTNNPHVTGGLTAENVAWAFKPLNPAGFWIPLTWLSLQLDATIGGHHISATPSPDRLPDAPPLLPDATVYHLHNIVLHIGATILLFFFLQAATQTRAASFLVALLWSIHPLRVESVAWVTERKDVLAAVFGFLAMLLYVHWARRPRIVLFIATAVAFLLSLMAKPMFVTLPALLVLLDIWPLVRMPTLGTLSKRIAEKWPLWIIAVAISALTVYTQAATAAVKTVADLPIHARVGHALVSYITYLVAHVRISNLAPGYPFRSTTAIEVTLAAIILAAITAACLWQRQARPWLLVGWLWFIIALLPMIGLVQAGEQGWADRFSYLPAVGLFLALVFAGNELWQQRPLLRPVLGVVGAAVLVTLPIFTVRQCTFWKDTITLFTRATQVSPDSFQIHGTLAAGYLREGQNEQAAQQYEMATRLWPTFAPAWLSLGWLRFEMADDDRAIFALNKAAELNPNDARTHKLYALALATAGRFEPAIKEFEIALALNPNDQSAARYLDLARQKLAEKKAATQSTTAPLQK